MRVTVIGCAGSFPRPDSAASCYLVEADDAGGRRWRVLLDLGNGALGPLQRRADPADLDAVALTHLHADHCLDLCALYVALRYDPRGRRQTRLPVYGPSRTLERLVRGYGLEGEGSLGEVFDVREWQHGAPVTIGPLSITPFLVDHPVEAYGLRVEHGGRVVAYTGDTDSCPALLPLARGADLLLAEASFQEGRDEVRGVHLTGRRAGQAAAQGDVARLVLTHLPAWNDPRISLAEARSAYAGPVELAEADAVYDV